MSTLQEKPIRVEVRGMGGVLAGTPEQYIRGERSRLSKFEVNRIEQLTADEFASELRSFSSTVDANLRHSQDVADALCSRFEHLKKIWVGSGEDGDGRASDLYNSVLGISSDEDIDAAAVIAFVTYAPIAHWQYVQAWNERIDTPDAARPVSVLIRALHCQWAGRPEKHLFITREAYGDQDDVEAHLQWFIASPAIPVADKKRLAQLVAHHAPDLRGLSVETLLYAAEPISSTEDDEMTRDVRFRARMELIDRANADRITQVFQNVSVKDTEFWMAMGHLRWIAAVHFAPVLMEKYGEFTSDQLDVNTILAHELYSEVLLRVLYPFILTDENKNAYAKIRNAVVAPSDMAVLFDLMADNISMQKKSITQWSDMYRSLRLLLSIWNDPLFGENTSFTRYGKLIEIYGAFAALHPEEYAMRELQSLSRKT